MWREYILPRHQRLNAAIHAFDVKLMYHSCGAIVPLIPDLIRDTSIDVLNPLQPQAKGMDLPRIKEEFGQQIAFHGGVDLQHTLPHGSPDEAEAIFYPQPTIYKTTYQRKTSWPCIGRPERCEEKKGDQCPITEKSTMNRLMNTNAW